MNSQAMLNSIAKSMVEALVYCEDIITVMLWNLDTNVIFLSTWGDSRVF